MEYLEPLASKEEDKISDVHWIEKDGENTDGDYCEDCVEIVLKERRAEYLKKQRALKVKDRDAEIAIFETHYNYGGGYESDYFNSCDKCGKRLDISILPNEEEIEQAIDKVEDCKTDSGVAYEIYWLLYNEWGEYKPEQNELTDELAKKVIQKYES